MVAVVRCRANGTDGFGEAPPLVTFTGETAADIVRTVRRDVAPVLLGKTVAEATRVLPKLATGTGARCAVDIALHDLSGRLEGRSVATILGGCAMASVAVSKAIGLVSAERAVELARAYVESGVGAVKLKVGRAGDEDARVVFAVREGVGPAVELSMDANGGLSASGAVALAKTCAKAKVAYFEQPVPRDDLDGLRRVRETGLAVLADESARDEADVDRLTRAAAVDAIGIKLVKCGGLRPAVRMAARAAAAGVACVVIDPLGSALSVAAGLHLAATLPEQPFAHGLAGALDVEAFHAEPLTPRRGRLDLPSGPGLGVLVPGGVEEAFAP